MSRFTEYKNLPFVTVSFSIVPQPPLTIWSFNPRQLIEVSEVSPPAFKQSLTNSAHSPFPSFQCAFAYARAADGSYPSALAVTTATEKTVKTIQSVNISDNRRFKFLFIDNIYSLFLSKSI